MRVAQAVGTVVAAEGLPVSQTGIVGDLEVVLAILRVEPELILWGLVVEEGDEAALGVGGVVEDLRDGGGEAVVGATAGDAQVPGGFVGVVAGG